jgi:hypothetical protein
MNPQSSIKRFIFGMISGLLLAAIAWSNSDYFNVAISMVQGIVGSIVLAITFGIIATIGSLDKLMDNLPFL